MTKRTNTSAKEDLRRLVSEALDLINRSAGGASHASVSPPPTGTLLDQCRTLVDRAKTRQPEPIRTVHQMACTGGTLMAKFIATLPNTVLISEVDPLSELHLRGLKKPFFPTDMIADLRYSPREIPRDVDIALFRAGLATLRTELQRQGRHLILRDHTHSRYHATENPNSRPGLLDIAAQEAPTLSVITVRHPLDSYLSLQKNNWVHFEPGTLDEYCRRYRLFLNDHCGIPIYKYEDFVDDPASNLEKIATELDLRWTKEIASLHILFRLSGDSGRRGFEVCPRERRPVPKEVAAEIKCSENYNALCQALHYTL